MTRVCISNSEQCVLLTPLISDVKNIHKNITIRPSLDSSYLPPVIVSSTPVPRPVEEF